MSATRTDRGTVDGRMDAGRALRGAVPRSAQAGFSSMASRPDPIAILQQQAQDRLAGLVPIRCGRMASSPFAFLRGLRR
jgi:hypothetical protein